MASKKSRTWAFIMYPDSAPDDWRETLEKWHMQMLISPLHNADLNADETEKKPHWHVVVVSEGPTTSGVVQEISDSVHGTRVQACKSLRAYARYLCHMDNPEKAQYKADDVVALGGIDYADLVASAADIDALIDQMEQWCDDEPCFSYAQLCRYARANRPDWSRVLRHKCTVHMKAYLQSCQWELDNHVYKQALEDEAENYSS